MKKPKSLRRRKSSNSGGLEFLRLEPRQLLAGISFNSATGVVTVDGSNLADSVLVSNNSTQISVSLTGSPGMSFLQASVTEVVFFAKEGDDSFRNDTAVKSRVYGQLGKDTLIGGSVNDVLNGGPGEDQIHGNGGNDILVGFTGDDYLNGGIGSDWMNGLQGNDNMLGEDGADTLIGELGDDTLDGGSGNDRMFGLSGVDLIYGRAGDDTIAGQDGDDWIYGGDGNDTLFGNAGLDLVAGELGDDKLYGGDDADRMFGDSGNDDIFGANGDDYMRGGSESDRLLGQSGSDDIDGENGNDDLEGGSGRDRIRGGSGNDDFLSDSSDDLLDDGDDYSADGDFEIRGTVSNLNTAAKTLTILGFTVNYSSARVEGTLANGAFFKAEGTLQNGQVVAHEVQKKLPGDSQDNFEARGIISSLDSAAKTFLFNGITVNYGNAQVAGTLQNGAIAKVEGILAGSVVTAREVKIGAGQDDNQGNRNFELRAAIANLNTTNKTFTLLGITVNYSSSLVMGTLSNGAFVKAQGNYDGTKLVAREIEPEANDDRDENVEIIGEVSNLNSSAKTFSILGFTISYANAELINPISNGSVMEVEGWLANSAITAEKIR